MQRFKVKTSRIDWSEIPENSMFRVLPYGETNLRIQVFCKEELCATYDAGTWSIRLDTAEVYLLAALADYLRRLSDYIANPKPSRPSIDCCLGAVWYSNYRRWFANFGSSGLRGATLIPVPADGRELRALELAIAAAYEMYEIPAVKPEQEQTALEDKDA